MEDEKAKEEDMPAPAFMQMSSEEQSKVVKSDSKDVSATEINNVLENLESISNNFTQELSSLSDKFKEDNKYFLKDLEVYKDNLITKFSQNNESDEKLSLKNQKLDSDSKFRSLTEPKIKLINKMTTLYTTLFDMIRSNMKIISKFLQQGKDLDKKQNLQDFFDEEFQNIVDSWLFMKIDFDNFKMNEALSKSELDDNFKNFIEIIYKKKDRKIKFEHMKNEVLNEELKKQINGEKKEIIESAQSLTKLTLKNYSNYEDIVDRKLIFEKLKKFYFENGKIKEENSIFAKSMPILEKFTIKNYPNLPFYILDKFPPSLKRLYLEKCNFVNSDFKDLFRMLQSNKDLLNNLEVLSLAGNNLTKTDFSILMSKSIFQSLEELNLRKNKIYKIIYNPDNFPKIKFINCCQNNLNRSYFREFGKILSLESGNGFLFEQELCKNYYDNLKKKICTIEQLPYVFDYLNISFMPKNLSKNYFNDFALNDNLMNKIRKLDLSYNGITCNIFFSFLEKNNNFSHLHSLNLNGNEIDDTFFEKLNPKIFPKLEHLYLNSNRIGDTNIKVEYKDDIPIDKENQQEKEKNLVYKVRLLYKFIEKMPYLSKLTITKNPISELYSVVKGENADKSEKFIKKDLLGKIAINCLFSMLIKIRDELLVTENKEKRKRFNLKFDCRSNVNRNSENYPYSDKPFVKKI